MTPKVKQSLMIAAIALLAVFAVAGWTRTPQARVNASYFAPDGTLSPVASNPVNYAQPQENCIEAPIAYTNAAYAPVPVNRYRSYSRPRVVRSYASSDDRVYRTVRNKRSTGKSVAIVAGSAGAGAAIGALAGGGKGAALGAVTGGTAGFIYDRLTHNK